MSGKMDEMRFDVVTIFPDAIRPFTDSALLGKAIERGLVEIAVHDLRDYTHDRHRNVDDEPYGGGPGMVMCAEPFFRAVEAITAGGHAHVLLLSPAGRPFDQAAAADFARRQRIVLLCGRYEGVDQRVADDLADEELSIGDYVLAGGEAAALVVIDAVARLVPGVVGEPASLERESFVDGALDHAHYTRPVEFRGSRVPDVLLSGDHAAIERWRRDDAARRTSERRPDLV